VLSASSLCLGETQDLVVLAVLAVLADLADLADLSVLSEFM
jgi:hypothetical protein